MKKVLLEIQGLTVRLPNGKALLSDINLHMDEGDVLGLIGKSGCGKSTLALTLARCFTTPVLTEGSILFKGEDILKMPRKRLQHMRSKELSIVFQEAQSSLNPLMKIGKQVGEGLKLQEEVIIQLLHDVGLRCPNSLINAYPHELSGGMRQRVLIAIAIAKNPDLLILDEPTTSLDSTLKIHIINLLKRLNIPMLYISHDLSEVASLCTHAAMMEEGRIVELKTSKEIALAAAKEFSRYSPKPSKAYDKNAKTLLKIDNLSVSYQKGKNALEGLSLHIREKEILGIVGESGSGKSTLAKALWGLARASGSITFNAVDLLNCTSSEKSIIQSQIQIIFQDPYASLNPKMHVKDAILEPLSIRKGKIPNADALVKSLLTQVLLPAAYADKLTTALSGGERQRVCIARALCMRPKLLIMDESLASLDKTTQLEIANFLLMLRETSEIAIIFIAHDLNLVRKVSDTIAVLYRGRLIEKARASSFFKNPAHPHSQNLLSSIPDKEHCKCSLFKKILI